MLRGFGALSKMLVQLPGKRSQNVEHLVQGGRLWRINTCLLFLKYEQVAGEKVGQFWFRRNRKRSLLLPCSKFASLIIHWTAIVGGTILLLPRQ